MIPRVLEPHLLRLAAKYPIVTVTGPRQAGKTTLCRTAFPDKQYVSLEAPDVQEYARTDPRSFLGQYSEGAILDEVHRVPELLSYLMPMVDSDTTSGRFILTGSANFALLQSLGQSLAGRTALLELLPLGLEEVRRFEAQPTDLYELLWRGSYPAIYDRKLDPAEWYPSYTATYLERDVRSLINIGSLVTFQTFLRLAAGRTGQLINMSSLGADAGINHGTAKAWLSVLEAGYVAFRLMPFHANMSKRLVKSPKLHFLDSGLVCYLLGIQSPDQLRNHPLRGAVFESWVASEILKSRRHRGLAAGLSFFRDARGVEVDMIVEDGPCLMAIEVKSGMTIGNDFFNSLDAFTKLMGFGDDSRALQSLLVYGGSAPQARTRARVVPWSELDQQAWWNSTIR